MNNFIIFLHITNLCNYTCEYCSEGLPQQANESKWSIPLNLVKYINYMIIQYLTDFNVHICLIGGETLLYPYLQEVIPIKSDAGIKYQYKYLSSEANNIDNAFIKIKKNNKKTIYTNKVKYIVTNCKSSKKIREYFKINNITIYHNKNVLAKLKEIIN